MVECKQWSPRRSASKRCRLPSWSMYASTRAILLGGLLVFGVVFALNSALHSYLIVSWAARDAVSLDVGFYYMANAAGRLLGTLMSGLSYQIGGLPLMLGAAAIMVALSALLVGFLKPDQG